ncbi:premnaspirodiene oxygenase-like [Papaver somniferum]|uniref:premnaspirodiene oxygenase-like n=1 Tax=Papaver somniferum TaxID=3469 RepID=UPI000E6F9E7E|nr:premnaspirodiene oxygenase-like [Papaver somniferum]
MDLQFSSTMLLLVFLVPFLFMVWMNTKMSTKQKLPPGPRKLPLVGNLHNMLGLTHQTLRYLSNKYGPLLHLQLGEFSVVFVSSPRVAKQIMNTHDLVFADRPEFFAGKITGYDSSGISLSPYGEYYKQVRMISTMEILSAKKVRSFRSLREEEVSNMIQAISLKSGSPINLSEKLTSLSNDIVSRAAFGNKCKNKEMLVSALQEAASLADLTFEDLFPSLKLLHFIGGMKEKLTRIHKKIDTILEEMIEEHKRDRSLRYLEEDFVDVLLRVQDSGELKVPLTTDNIKAVIADIFAGGTESTGTTIEWAMSELLKNPCMMEKVQTEVRQVFDGKKQHDETDIAKLEYLKLVVKETMRLHPPAPLLVPRECRERCEIDGYDIPAKTKVVVNAWAIARDPEYWNDADEFQPERFRGNSVDYKGTNFEYIPFGAGRRICPGISFGVAVVELTLAQLLYHFDSKLSGEGKPEDLDMTELYGITVRRKYDLVAIPIPYVPS